MTNPARPGPSTPVVGTDHVMRTLAHGHEGSGDNTGGPAGSAPPHPDATFSMDWLALRATADAAARADELTARAATWLRERRGASGGSLVLTDLGTGCGANPRHLAPRLPGLQHWRLLDHDPRLLARARETVAGLRDLEGHGVTADILPIDLRELREDTLAGTDLVCASALLDLVDAGWLGTLAAACQRADAAVLVTLSVDGEWRFFDRDQAQDDADDALVRERFNAHQRRDKGLGPALGPEAAPALAAALGRHGYRVDLVPSPWQLSMSRSDHATLAARLLAGWCAAAIEEDPGAARIVTAWHRRRQAALGDPRKRLRVGHLDLFASPSMPGWPA